MIDVQSLLQLLHVAVALDEYFQNAPVLDVSYKAGAIEKSSQAEAIDDSGSGHRCTDA